MEIDLLILFFHDHPALSRSKVAEEAGIHRNTLNDILRGRFGLTNDVAQKLLPVLQKYGFKK